MNLKLISFIGILFIMQPCHGQTADTILLPPALKAGGMSLMEALAKRESQREYSSKELSPQQISNLLWAAYGVNRPNGSLTVPSAHSFYEFDIYLIKSDGWYRYEPKEHVLLKIGKEDLREYAGTQEYVKTAPVNLVYVADFGRMADMNEDDRKFYSACDVGYISQNVYLCCAAEGLATVVRGGIDKTKVKQVLNLQPTQYIILAQTIGYAAE